MKHSFRNTFSLALARRRRWKRPLLSMLPRIAFIDFPSGECLAIDTHDDRGPSFHMAHGWRQAEKSLSSYEPGQRQVVESFLRRRSQDGSGLLFLDIGANIGLFTFSAKRALPKLTVAAFEPHPVTAECLEESVRRSGFAGIRVERIALSDSRGTGQLHLDESDSGGHSLIASNLWNNRRKASSLDVKLDTLDDWAKAQGLAGLDFIKMDIQGNEDAALRGGLGSLEKFRPGLLIEVQHELVENDDAVIGILRELPFSYEVQSMTGEKGTYGDLKAWSKREFEKGILFADYVFLPPES